MMTTTDYAKLRYKAQCSHERFVRHVEQYGVPCQDCNGMGGEKVVVLEDSGEGPFEECGWCLGTGRTTKRLREIWLGIKRTENREKITAKPKTP